MPLIVRGPIEEGISLREGISRVRIRVPSNYLSKPYELSLFDEVYAQAKIENIEPIYGRLSPDEEEVIKKYVIGRDITLYVSPGFFLGVDDLYFTRDSWTILRDAGILPNKYILKLEIYKLVIKEFTTGKERQLDVYPFRKISIEA